MRCQVRPFRISSCSSVQSEERTSDEFFMRYELFETSLSCLNLTRFFDFVPAEDKDVLEIFDISESSSVIIKEGCDSLIDKLIFLGLVTSCSWGERFYYKSSLTLLATSKGCLNAILIIPLWPSSKDNLIRLSSSWEKLCRFVWYIFLMSLSHTFYGDNELSLSSKIISYC